MTASTYLKEKRIKMWTEFFIGKFKTQTEEHNKKCYYIYVTKPETSLFVDIPELLMPPTMVNSIKDNLRITDTHLKKMYNIKRKNLNLPRPKMPNMTT